MSLTAHRSMLDAQCSTLDAQCSVLNAQRSVLSIMHLCVNAIAMNPSYSNFVLTKNNNL